MNKILILLTLLTINLLACTGDCLTCHPALLPTIKEDSRHKAMLTCINCHSANPSSMAECGSDCFECHSMAKINKPNVREHDVIQECRDCHMKMSDDLKSLNLNPTQSYTQEPLKDVLFSN